MLRKRPVLLALSFFLPLFLLLLLSALLSLAPFGTRTLLCADARNQYISYFAFYQDLFAEGKGWLYTFEKVLGGSTVGFFAYYLASPLDLLLLAFPGEKLSLGVECLILLKLSLCALSFALYLDSRARLRPSALLFTTAYALCGYNLAFCWCAMWLDAVILLPLVVWGIDRLFEHDRPLLYLFSLASAIFTCFYTGYMLCLFSALYFLCLLLRSRPPLRALPWRRLLRFALASLGAAALSAVLLLPALRSFQGASASSLPDRLREYTYPVTLYVLQHLLPGRGEAFYAAWFLPALAALCLLTLLFSAAVLWAIFSSRKSRIVRAFAALACLAAFLIWYGTAERFFQRSWVLLPENQLAAKLFCGVIDFGEMYDGSPNLYIGQLCLLLALGSFFNRSIPAAERRANLLILVLFGLSLTLYLPNLLWHGLQRNHCFNYRYSFVVCFFLLTLAERSFSAREGLDRRAVLLPSLFLLLNAVLVLIRRPSFLDARLYLPLLLWLLLSSGALLLWLKRPCALALLFAVHFIALGFTAALSLDTEADNGLSTEHAASVYRLREQFSTLPYWEAEPYRVRKARIVLNYCDPMYLSYPSALSFSSTESAAAVELAKSAGLLVMDGHWANIDAGSSRAADTLFGVRYVLAERFADYLPRGDGFLENPYALPFAFGAPGSALSAPALGSDPCENMNRLFAALVPDSAPVFVPAEAPELTAPDARSLRIQVRVTSPEPLYLSLRTGALASVSLSTQDGEERVWNGETLPAAQCLGSFSSGELLTLELRFHSERPELGGSLLYYEQSPALKALRERLSLSPCTLRAARDSRLSATVVLDGEDAALVFLIPSEAGWQVSVDGMRTEVGEALGSLLAIPLSPGEHQVELRFVPPGLLPGAALSASTLLLTVLWALLRRRKRQAA